MLIIEQDVIIPANTRRYLDVYSTFFERYGRLVDVKKTLCAYWDPPLVHNRISIKRQFAFTY